jgi:hypothetical protein
LKELFKEHRDLIIVLFLFVCGLLLIISMSNSEANMMDEHNKKVGDASGKICHAYFERLAKSELNTSSELKTLQDARNACFHYMTYIKAGKAEVANLQAELELAEKTMSAVDMMTQKQASQGERN